MSTNTGKHTLYRTIKLICFLLFVVMLFYCGIIAHATNDDPGAGRLSGANIPEAFYETQKSTTLPSTSAIPRYGNATTKSPYTEKTYTHQAEYADRPITHGIDVSEWQGEIDWAKVKADGVKFAFIRLGYRGSGEGKLSDDKYFKQNIENALASGIEVGVYIFSQAITENEAREEANYVLERIKDYYVTFPIVIDYEFTDGTGRLEKANLSQKKATDICLAFCETIEAAGYTPMVYANPVMLYGHLNREDISNRYLVWLANYTTETAYSGKYDYWQYASNGSVDGIKGNVDVNFFYGTDIANATIAPIADHLYTGEKLNPTLTITYKDRILTEGTDFTVKYSNNKNVGTAGITITGKNIFYGSRNVTFKIMPRQMSAVKAKKKSDDYITLSWKKDSSVSGYEIYRSSAQNGKYNKIATISKKSTTTYKNTGLTNGQCYYYKIRSYKNVNDKKWYGAFSEIQSIYTQTGYTRNATTKSNAALYISAAVDEAPVIVPAKNDTLSVIYATKDKSGKTWYHVSYKKEGQTYKGFVQSNKVTITKLGKITSKNVNVRKSNNMSSKVITKLNKNKKVTILKTKKKNGTTWYQVTFKKNNKTYKGWISAQYIKLI